MYHRVAVAVGVEGGMGGLWERGVSYQGFRQHCRWVEG